jgi:hypothetical protein
MVTCSLGGISLSRVAGVDVKLSGCWLKERVYKTHPCMGLFSSQPHASLWFAGVCICRFLGFSHEEVVRMKGLLPLALDAVLVETCPASWSPHGAARRQPQVPLESIVEDFRCKHPLVCIPCTTDHDWSSEVPLYLGSQAAGPAQHLLNPLLCAHSACTSVQVFP